MTVIEIGNIRGYNGMPGILIEATKDEIGEIAGNILYQSVSVLPADLVPKDDNGKDPSFYRNRMLLQIERCGDVCTRLNADRRRKYSVAEVEAILDEVLDGVKKGGDNA